MNRLQRNILNDLNKNIAASQRHIRKTFDRHYLGIVVATLSLGIVVSAVGLVYEATQYDDVLEAYDDLLAMSDDKDKQIAMLERRVDAKQNEIDELTSKLSYYEHILEDKPNYFMPDEYYVGASAAPQIYESIPLSEELQQYTYTMCCYFDIPEMYDEMLTIMWQESEFTTDKTHENENGSVDYGLMQINSCNLQSLEDNLNITDIMDPQQNICSGCYLLRSLLNYYHGNTGKAIMAYNMGAGNADALIAKGISTSQYTDEVSYKLIKLQADQYE